MSERTFWCGLLKATVRGESLSKNGVLRVISPLWGVFKSPPAHIYLQEKREVLFLLARYYILSKEDNMKDCALFFKKKVR